VISGLHATLTFFSFVVSSLYEHKNDKHMIEKHHAAAGKDAAF
jgi:hypothetical protein